VLLGFFLSSLQQQLASMMPLMQQPSKEATTVLPEENQGGNMSSNQLQRQKHTKHTQQNHFC